MRTVTLTLTDIQIEALNEALLNRQEAIDENIGACDEDDDQDAENIEAYRAEQEAIEDILKQLEGGAS